ncbi:hypothetical protein, partial [Streptomyces sp. NPDC058412]|uniref:hypothetical protein n=1 Tax=Streptomyces sp. NPDC058412 TaxID=3346486 RepID=UPI00364F9349
YQLLALIFGTLLSSQGTDASFVLTLSGFPPGFRSVLAFPTLPDHFRAVSGLDLNSVTVGGLCLSALHHVSAYPLPFIIEWLAKEFGHAEWDPARGKS